MRDLLDIIKADIKIAQEQIASNKQDIVGLEAMNGVLAQRIYKLNECVYMLEEDERPPKEESKYFVDFPDFPGIDTKVYFNFEDAWEFLKRNIEGNVSGDVIWYKGTEYTKSSVKQRVEAEDTSSFGNRYRMRKEV